MKVLDKISLRKMLAQRENCPQCLGRGYSFVITPALDATKFRVIYPCSCVKQVVRIEEEKQQ